MLFGINQGIHLVHGEWRTGKTNFVLKLCDDAIREGWIKQFAGNIPIEEPPESYTYIDNMPTLKYWLFKTKQSKAFIFDEAIETAMSRNAMSRINKMWLEVIPELSKAKCKLFVLCQEEDLIDNIFRKYKFKRSEIVKLSWDKALIKFRGFKEPLTISGIKPTILKYDPDTPAVFKAEGKIEIGTKPFPLIASLIENKMVIDKVRQQYPQYQNLSASSFKLIMLKELEDIYGISLKNFSENKV